MVIRREQTEIKKLYGDAFVEYCSRVPAFWPRFSAAPNPGEHFSWAQYLKNREYEACHRSGYGDGNPLGLDAVAALIVRLRLGCLRE